jgi:hypothetical protein
MTKYIGGFTVLSRNQSRTCGTKAESAKSRNIRASLLCRVEHHQAIRARQPLSVSTESIMSGSRSTFAALL